MMIEQPALIRDIRSSRALRKTLLIYIAVTMVLFMAILFFYISNSINEDNEQWLQVAEATLEQARATNATYIHSLTDYMLQYIESYEVRATLYNAEYSQYLSVRSRNVYTQLTSISSLVRNAQFVNFNTDTVLDANGRFAFNIYGDAEVLDLISSLQPSIYITVYHPREMNVASMRLSPVRRKVISMIYYQNRAGALVLNLDYETFKSIVLPDAQGGPTDYCLVNGSGMLFCGTDDTLFGANISQDPIYQQVLAQQAGAGAFALDGHQVVTYRRDASFGAVYYAVTALATLTPGSPLFWDMVWLGLAFLLGSLLLSTGLALLTSRPIRRLHRSVRERLDEGMLPDEDDEI